METTETRTAAEIAAEVNYLEGLAEAFERDGDGGSAWDVHEEIETLKKTLTLWGWYGGIAAGY